MHGWNKMRCLALLAGGLVLSASSRAAVISWNNPAGGDFNAGANWAGGVAPGLADQALFPDLPGLPGNVNFSADASVLECKINETIPSFDLSSRTLSISDSLWVGSGTGSSGFVNFINGNIVTDYLLVGESLGQGTASINASTRIDVFESVSVADFGAQGLGSWLFVAGSQGELIEHNALTTYIGRGPDRDGRLSVQSGAYAEFNGNFYVGYDGASGEVIVNGPLSTLVTLLPSATATIAQSNGANGTATVRNAGVWDIQGLLTVGSAAGGIGSLHVESGGLVTATSLSIGGGAGAVGQLIAMDEGSTVDVSGSIQVGGSGAEGTLDISTGADVSMADQFTVGAGAGSTGYVTLSGAGSTLTLIGNGSAMIGSSGVGALEISAGGSATFGSILYAGGFAGGAGTVEVAGSASSLIADDLRIGWAADSVGSLLIINGATVTAGGYHVVGNAAGSAGFVRVYGNGSTLNTGCCSPLRIGEAGAGQMAIEAGGTVTNLNGAIGTQPGGIGSVFVSGQGSEWTSSGAAVQVGSAGGAGFLAVYDGGAVTASGGVNVASGGGAMVLGDGEIQANVTNSGYFYPGSFSVSPGTMMITGNYTQTSSGELWALLTDGVLQVDISGTASLAGALRIVGPNLGETPVAGNIYPILQSTGSLSGTLATVIQPDFNDGLHYIAVINPGAPGTVHVHVHADCNNNGINDPQDIVNQTSQDANGDGIPDECSAPSGGCAQQQKLTASDATSDDSFGNSVSVSGDTVVVGADEAGGPGTASGAAYVFVRSGEAWSQQQKLTPSDPGVGDKFGWAVSVDGNSTLAGAPGNDDGGSASGSAYVFVRSGTVWSQQQKLTASDAATFDSFGASVSLSGDTALIGADHEDGVGDGSGAAYVFVRSGTVWGQQQKLTASDAAAFDNFGNSVSVDGNTAIVGSRFDDGVGTDSGSAYVFVRSGAVWTQQQKLTPSDAAAVFNFGLSVSVSGDTAIIGAHSASGGCAYVFVRSAGVWIQQQKLTSSDLAVADQFGISVSVSGDKALIGADADDGVSADSGSAYIFVRSGGVWTQEQKLIASDADAGDRFGFSVSASGDTAIIGAYRDESMGFNSGSAYVFSCCADNFWFCEQNWTLAEVPGESSPDYNVNLGTGDGLCLDGDLVINSLSLNEGASLDMGDSDGGACDGDLTLASVEGLTVDDGTLVVGPGRTIGHSLGGTNMVIRNGGSVSADGSDIDLGSGDLLIESGGRYISASTVTSPPNAATLTANNITMRSGFSSFPSEITLSGDMELTANGSILVDGSGVPCDCGAAGFANRAEVTPPVFSADGRRWIAVNEMTFKDAARIRFGSAIGELGGDFVNEATCAQCVDTSEGTLVLDGPGLRGGAGRSGTTTQRFEVASPDLGPTAIIADQPYAIGTIEVAAGGDVTFDDRFDNDGAGQAPCTEALYVRNLTLGAGATVTALNVRLYYEALTKDPTATLAQVGCGVVEQVACVPAEPATSESSPQPKSRFLSINPSLAVGSTALEVRVISVPGAPAAVNGPPYNYPAMMGDVWWVGPATIRANDQTPYTTAELQCTGTPLIQDWSLVGDIHIFGDAIVPGATYEIRACCDVGGPCSAPLVLATARHGDVRTLYGVTDFADISALVGEFSTPNAPSSLLKPHAWITPSNLTTTMGAPFGFNQISAGVTAFSGGAPPAPTLGANQCP